MRISNQVQMQPLRPFWMQAKVACADQSLSERIDCASEHSYSKEDAIKSQYNRSTAPNVSLKDIINGNANIKVSIGSPEELAAYQKVLEEKGLGDSIKWSSVQHDFSSVDVEKDTTKLVGSKVDYIASRYAVLKNRINNNYSGDERNEQLDKLDGLYSNAKELLADSYTNQIGEFLEKNVGTGICIDDEMNDLKESLLKGIDDQSEKYLSYIQENSNYVQLESAKDKWLLQDDGYCAAQLREHLKSDHSAQSAAYSVKDLTLLGQYAEQVSDQYESLDHTGIIRNEERVGLDLAVQSMKADYFTKNSGMSNRMASLVKRTTSGYMQNYLNKLDNEMQKDANNSQIPGSQQKYASIDKSAVYQVYQYTMRQYQNSDDMFQALTKGAEYGKKQYEKKVDSSAYGSMVRYQSKVNSDYTWDNFFSVTKMKNYDINISDMEKYRLTLDRFKASVNNSDMQSIDFELGLNGNQSSDRVTYYNISEYTKMGWTAYA